MSAALPTVIVIGAMKCATSAVHEHLDGHPEVSMSRPKELNFFNGPQHPPHQDEQRWWRTGQWHRGVDWYARQFDGTAPARGESSPAYTAPTSPEVPERMAAVVPDVRLLYLVRDPVDRAVSQYLHHHREGDERRPLGQALLDPGSQYLSRSRYHERLAPFLDRFRREQVHVVVQERLGQDPHPVLEAVYRHAEVDPGWRGPRHGRRFNVGTDRPPVEPRLRAQVAEAVADDVTRLRRLLGDDLGEWAC